MLITYDHGKSFPVPLQMMGWALTIGSLAGIISKLLGILEGNWVLFLASAIGGYLLIARTGTQLDNENRSFREYQEYFWIETARWQDFFNCPNMAELRTLYANSMMSRGMVETKSHNVVFEVYLLSSRQRRRVLVSKHEDIIAAQEKAKELSATFGLSYVKFNPH